LEPTPTCATMQPGFCTSDAPGRRYWVLGSSGVKAAPVSQSLERISLLRKLIHVAMALVPLCGWLIGHWLATAIAAALVVASLALEAARQWWPWVNRLLWRIIPSVFRGGEERHLLGSTWFALGAWLTLLLFGRDAGGTAVLFLAWGDPAAELVGRRWGRPGQRKTLAGSVGCLLACLAGVATGIWLGGLPLVPALAGVFTATAVERWSPPPDDNLWMPVLSGAVMLGVQSLLGA
jgi:dolichol kinase